jgi:hypothetical protein
MQIRSLVLSLLIVSGTGLAAAQALPDAPTPRPVIPAPHYTGPMGINPTPFAFPAPPTNQSAPHKITIVPRVAVGQVVKLIPPSSRRPTCYAIRSYTIKPESDTIGITHPSSESTCVAADTSSMKQAIQPATGPEFR